MSEVNNIQLPEGWKWVKLKEIGKIVSGGTPSTKIKDYFDGNIPWITPSDLTGYKDKFISKGKRNISEIGLKNSSAKLLPKGSILFSSRAPIGYVVISNSEVATNQGFKNLIPSKEVFNEFVYYYLKASKSLAQSLASGTTFLEISAGNFGSIPIPLPPLPESCPAVSLQPATELADTGSSRVEVEPCFISPWAKEEENPLDQPAGLPSELLQPRTLRQRLDRMIFKVSEMTDRWFWEAIYRRLIETGK